MTIREQTEQLEHQILCRWATFADRSAGRQHAIEPCPIRTCFARDRDRIIHSKAFRRLSNKTQVFISPEGDHYRTRLTHTLEVSQIARTIARALRLNEDLVEAIALGHDLGHTPLGHAGERALNAVCPEGFRHNAQSVRMVSRIEPLNLSREVLDGIGCHTGPKRARTPEGRLIHYADRIAYVNHDIDDAIRARILAEREIPRDIQKTLGATHGQRIDTLVRAVIDYGTANQEVGMAPEAEQAMLALRRFLFERVYDGQSAEQDARAEWMLRTLYNYYIQNFGALPAAYRRLEQDGDSRERIVCDYLASMTDRYAIACCKDLFLPRSWNRT